MARLDDLAGESAFPIDENGYICMEESVAVKSDGGSVLRFRVNSGVVEVDPWNTDQWIAPIDEEFNVILDELKDRIDPEYETLQVLEGRLKLLVKEPEDAEDSDESDPDDTLVARRSFRDRIKGVSGWIFKKKEPEVYVKGVGFTKESEIGDDVREYIKSELNIDDAELDAIADAYFHPGLTMDPKVAKSAINGVKLTADAERNVRRFAAIWEDLTLRIPFTQKRLPIPAADPLISTIPVVGEVMDGVLPTGVFWYNGLKAGLGVKPLATGTALQFGNFALHLLKYGGPTIVVKFVVDWFFNSVTATTHDFTARRQQAIAVARGFGITEEDIDKVSAEAIRRSNVTEEKTQNSREFKRAALEVAKAFFTGYNPLAGAADKTFGGAVATPWERFLDTFYPLDEDRKAAEKSGWFRGKLSVGGKYAGALVGQGPAGLAGVVAADAQKKLASAAKEAAPVSPELANLAAANLLYEDILHKLPPEGARRLQAQVDRVKARKLEPNEADYAKALKQLFEYDKNAVLRLSDEVQARFKALMNKSGFARSNPFSESKSWSLWDIAKQFHYFKNHGAEPTEYHLGNPLLDTQVQDEMVYRHFGWELYQKWQVPAEREIIENLIASAPNPTEIEALLDKTPKENNTLSSKDLAELGGLVARVVS